MPECFNHKSTKMKKLLILILCLFTALSAGAVLKEKNLTRTLGVLRAELEKSYLSQKQFMAQYEQTSRQQHAQLVDYMQRSEQVGLMLYSQKTDFTLDVAYACQQATNLYAELHTTNLPYEQIRTRLHEEVARYDSLITSLEALPPAVGVKKSVPTDSLLMELTGEEPDSMLVSPYTLSEAEQQDREQCLVFAKAIRNNLVRLMNTLLADSRYYDLVSQKMESLNNYALERYSALQQSIFVNGGSNYFTTLANLPLLVQTAHRDISEKYVPLGTDEKSSSEWRGPIVLGTTVFVLFYLLIAALVSNVILRFCIPKRFRTDRFREKRGVIITAVGVLLFAIVLMFVRSFIDRNFIRMAASLLINMAWLGEALLVSLLIRLNAQQLKHGVVLYLPFLCMAFLVVVFRILLVPNTLVNLIYPPLLLGFTWWQMRMLTKHRKGLPESDMIYSIISLVAMIVACVVSWAGYVLLAVQIMVWWMYQLAAIQTITCIYFLLEKYEKHSVTKKIKRENPETAEVSSAALVAAIKKGDYISTTWAFDLVCRALVPIMAVASVLMSVWMAADLFDMTTICTEAFYYNFIEKEGIISLSIDKLCMVVGCLFLFRYINYTARALYHRYRQRRSYPGENINFTLADNIIAILTWGAYFIYCLVLLQVPASGISIVTAGLATGMGFAMKDLLENFFYGISLMTGRVRVGDFIECDGIQGKVESITYQSTQVSTLDGSVIAFLNTALFNKSFKNLTRNHSYELVKINIGVAYGTEVETARRLITEALEPLREKNAMGLDIVSPQHDISVAIDDFGGSSVDLKVIAWVLVTEKAGFKNRAREIIYNTLNAHHIEIPFPQCDINLRSLPEGFTKEA